MEAGEPSTARPYTRWLVPPTASLMATGSVRHGTSAGGGRSGGGGAGPGPGPTSTSTSAGGAGGGGDAAAAPAAERCCEAVVSFLSDLMVAASRRPQVGRSEHARGTHGTMYDVRHQSARTRGVMRGEAVVVLCVRFVFRFASASSAATSLYAPAGLGLPQHQPAPESTALVCLGILFPPD